MDNDTGREGWCLLERIIPKHKIDGGRAHVEAAHEKPRRIYEAMGGNIGFQTGPAGEPGTCPIAYLSEFVPCPGDERLLAVHVRWVQIVFRRRQKM
ncbi:MAG TPA: hypothetical protein EYQ20_20880 [candidate division Zixibacteria bacterium]|nr:hypothetical protein [candidate division Zixibacteria bacterium]